MPGNTSDRIIAEYKKLVESLMQTVKDRDIYIASLIEDNAKLAVLANKAIDMNKELHAAIKKSVK